MTLPNPPSVPSDHILKTDRLGRVHTPPDERERLLAAFEQSSMTMKAFAEHHGIKYQTFTYWCAQRRKRDAKAKPINALAPFAEVQVTLPKEIELKISLPGGATVVMSSPEQAPLVRALLEACGGQTSC